MNEIGLKYSILNTFKILFNSVPLTKVMLSFVGPSTCPVVAGSIFRSWA